MVPFHHRRPALALESTTVDVRHLQHVRSHVLFKVLPAILSTLLIIPLHQNASLAISAPEINQSLTASQVTAARGIFRFASTDWSAIHAAGFNASTDGGVQDNGAAQAAAGITGMVWVAAYDNQGCAQTMTNSTIAAMVQANVNAGRPGLRYQIGDEPTAYGCKAAMAYSSITQAVHSADSSAKTWVADDQFQDGNPVQQGIYMKGTVDILAFDVYPCRIGNSCNYAAIDSAVQQIHAAGLTNWEFILQDFSDSSWRWPTPAEIQAQFDHWKGQGASGYWVYAWDYLGATVTSQPGNVAALQSINSQNLNPAPYALGVVGTDNGLWVLHSGSAGFVSDSGILLGAPAVVAIPQSSGPAVPLYIATGSDHGLWVRNDSHGWQSFGGAPIYCIDNPGAAVIAGTLYVACQGQDHALWHGETPAPTGTNLPSLDPNGWQSLGGLLSAGPAVSSVAGTPTYFVVGTDQHVYSRDLSSGFVGYSWTCIGHPAVATSGSTSYFACHGSDNALWYSTNTGSGWSSPQSLGGVLIDGVGLAATSTGPIFFVEGTDQAVYQRTISAGWTSDGGEVNLGVGGCAL